MSLRGFNMPWFLLFCFLGFTSWSSEGTHEKKLPSAVVVGTVYCDTCFQGDFSKSSHLISGASVAVECKDRTLKPSFRKEVKTDEHGEFRVHLPFSVSKHVRKIKRCSVMLLSSSEPYCAVASTATSTQLRLKSRKQGFHVFSAGFFTFKPLKQPNLCYQKPSVQNSEELGTSKSSTPFSNNPAFPTFPPPLQDPPNDPYHLPPLPGLPGLPPLPELPPLPPLPPLPGVPGLPGLPPTPRKAIGAKPVESSRTVQLSDQETAQPEREPVESSRTVQLSDQETAHPDFFFPPPILPPNPFQPPPLIPPILPPNPFQPPPAPLIPNPFQPPPAPLIPNPFQPPPAPLIPNPFQPPPAPLFPFPPIPGFTPSPPPPPPRFLFPLPPFPFPPPRIPGIPPASSSSPQPSP